MARLCDGGPQLGPGNVVVRAVESPSARVGAMSVSMWEGYAEAVHARWVGDNVGWDRILDNHFGFQVRRNLVCGDANA
jgi:hypothetical protein